MIKKILILMFLASPAYADEMKAIGSFRVPDTVFDRLQWVELQSDEYGTIQCVVRNGNGSGGVSCNWPKEKDIPDPLPGNKRTTN